MKSIFFRIVPIEPLFPVVRTLDAANRGACNGTIEQEGENNKHCPIAKKN